MRHSSQIKAAVWFSLLAYIPSVARAHCPLCTAGAGALALLAASLGVPALVIATLLGGFAMAMGLWFGGALKKQYVRFQYHLIAGAVYLLTVVPLWPVLKEYKALYFPLLGIDKYATTVPIDVYVLGVVVGAAVLVVSPSLSARIARWAGGRKVPFQGVAITLMLLVVAPFLIDIFFLV